MDALRPTDRHSIRSVSGSVRMDRQGLNASRAYTVSFFSSGDRRAYSYSRMASSRWGIRLAKNPECAAHESTRHGCAARPSGRNRENIVNMHLNALFAPPFIDAQMPGNMKSGLGATI